MRTRDQQDYEIEDRYAPVLKTTEARLPVAIAAQHGADLYGTDTKQEFLYGDMAEDEDIYDNLPGSGLQRGCGLHNVARPGKTQMGQSTMLVGHVITTT